MGVLARVENITPPTITGIVARLEDKGMVRREPDPQDARSMTVSATGAGLEAIGAVRRERTAFLVERISRLGPDERGILEEATTVLAKLVVE